MKRQQNSTIYECIKNLPVSKMLEQDLTQLEFWEKEVRLEIETLKEFGLKGSNSYRRAILSLKWIQGLIRIKKYDTLDPKNTPKRKIVMVFNLKED